MVVGCAAPGIGFRAATPAWRGSLPEKRPTIHKYDAWYAMLDGCAARRGTRQAKSTTRPFSPLLSSPLLSLDSYTYTYNTCSSSCSELYCRDVRVRGLAQGHSELSRLHFASVNLPLFAASRPSSFSCPRSLSYIY